jgi:polyribonucleotide nucleotidyltransferase
MGEMLKAIAEPREDYGENVPRFELMTIPGEFIGAVIGPGGKVIQDIQKKTNATVSITEVDNTGKVEIFADNLEDLKAAKARIKAIVAIPEVGETYEAKVKSIMPYGAFVEFMPGKEGLLHISEYDWKRLESLNGLVKEGDMVQVNTLVLILKTEKQNCLVKHYYLNPKRLQQLKRIKLS